MMKNRLISSLIVFVGIALTALAFQNCASDFDIDAYSNAENLSSEDPPTTAPVILNQSGNISVELNEPAALFVTASGGGLSYGWKKNGVAIPNSSNILNIPSVTTNDVGTYTLNIVNTLGSASATFDLSLVPTPTPPPPNVTPTPTPPPTFPVVTNPPDDVYALAGTQAAFQVVASGGSLTYQWFRTLNSGGSETLIPGATASVYSFSASLTLQGTYRVEVRNSAGVVSARANLSVVPRGGGGDGPEP